MKRDKEQLKKIREQALKDLKKEFTSGKKPEVNASAKKVSSYGKGSFGK